MTKRIPITAISIDGETQSRVAIIEDAVNEYADLMAHGTVFAPITVHFDGIKYWLSDGFHRYWAHKKCQHAVVEVEVIEGTVNDALWYAAGANVSHGLRRSNADKRRAVEMALRVHAEMSNAAIASHCQVSDMLVAEVRARLRPQELEVKRIGRDGRTCALPAKRKAPPPPPPIAEPPVAEPPTVTRPPVPPPVPTNVTPLYKDELGRDIPAYLNEAWYERKELHEMMWRIRNLRQGVEVRRADGSKVFGRIAETTMAAWKALEHALEDAMPYALCPICNGGDGTGCQACRETGFVSKLVYDNAIGDEYKGGAK